MRQSRLLCAWCETALRGCCRCCWLRTHGELLLGARVDQISCSSSRTTRTTSTRTILLSTRCLARKRCSPNKERRSTTFTSTHRKFRGRFGRTIRHPSHSSLPALPWVSGAVVEPCSGSQQKPAPPNLANSVRLLAHVHSVCCPSRSELFSGRLNHNIRMPTPSGGCMHMDSNSTEWQENTVATGLQAAGCAWLSQSCIARWTTAPAACLV